MRSIDRALAKGGNYLLNVGPKPDGTLPQESVDILNRVGVWYNTVKESFAQPASHKTDNPDVLLTERENALCVHLYHEPIMSRVLLNPLDQLPVKATLLNTRQELPTYNDSLPTLHMDKGGLLAAGKKDYLRIAELPVNELAGQVLVIKLEF
jgi:alpha-L-fucosidase